MKKVIIKEEEINLEDKDYVLAVLLQEILRAVRILSRRINEK